MKPSTVFNVDCMEYMKSLPDKAFDFSVCDPPYGIGVDRHRIKSDMTVIGGGGRPFGGQKNNSVRKKQRRCESKFYHPFDDSSAPDEGYFKELMRVSKYVCIWGGNFFLDYLGKASCLIVWDKGRRGLDQADCEIAWTNLPGQSRVFNYKWNGMLQENMKNKEVRVHPTQKPVALYEWVLSTFCEKEWKVFDSHLGSGSSRIAAYNLGYEFVGCEIDKYYFDEQEKRFERHTSQLSLFN